jgi:hypothetical protein
LCVQNWTLWKREHLFIHQLLFLIFIFLLRKWYV